MNVSFSVNLNGLKNYVVNKFKGHDEPPHSSHLPPETEQKKDAIPDKQVKEEEEAKQKTAKPQPQQQQQQQTEQNPNPRPGGLNTTSRIDEHGMIEITYSLGGQKLIERADPNTEYGKAWMADHPNDFGQGKEKQQASAKSDAKSDVPDAVNKLPPDALAQVNNIKTQTEGAAPPMANASLPAVQKGNYIG